VEGLWFLSSVGLCFLGGSGSGRCGLLSEVVLRVLVCVLIVPVVSCSKEV